MKPSIYILGALLTATAAQAAELVTVTVTVTNAPIGNTNTLTVNGSTRTFTNDVSASPGTLIQQTNSRPYTATNILNHAGQYPFGNGFYVTQTTETNVTIRGTPGTTMSASIAGLWGTISFSTQTVFTPTYVVRVPYTNEATAVRTNIASGIAEYLNLSTNRIATNAAALEYYVHEGFGTQQVIRTSLQVTQLNGVVSALTNGYWTNAALDKPTATNVSVYGGFQSLGSGSLSTLIGSNATASGIRSFAAGNTADASGDDSLAIGTFSVAGDMATAIGISAFATNSSVAVGNAAAAVRGNSVAINGSAAGANGFAVLGEVNADYGIALGASADVETLGTNSLALGHGALVQYSNSVALGAFSAVTASNQIRLGTSLHDVSIPGTITSSGVAQFQGGVSNFVSLSGSTNILRGDLSFPPTTSTSASVTNVLATGTNVILRITGTPGAAWTLAGISGPNRDGLFRILYNDTGFTLTIGNEAGTAPDASTRIRTMTGADVSTGTNAVCQFFYDGTRSRWVLISHNP